MEDKDMLSFDEVDLNYILEAVQHFRQEGEILGSDMAVYSGALEHIENRILSFLSE